MKKKKRDEIYSKTEYRLFLAECRRQLAVCDNLLKRVNLPQADRVMIQTQRQNIINLRDEFKLTYTSTQVKFLKQGLLDFQTDMKSSAVTNIILDFSDIRKNLSLKELLEIGKKKR